jgi:hypothetical protein
MKTDGGDIFDGREISKPPRPLYKHRTILFHVNSEHAFPVKKRRICMRPTAKSGKPRSSNGWSGRFFCIDDLWSMSAAQIKAAVTMDRMADDDGRVAYPPERIARIAGVSKPRVSEAAGILAARGLAERRKQGTSECGYRLTRVERFSCAMKENE